MVQYSLHLTDAEREAALRGKASVSVGVEGEKQNILRDRKRLLWFLGLVMDSDGVIAVDHRSTQFWSRERLDDELMHDSDVDVSALFEVHAVGEKNEPQISWLHTHGLAEIDAFDFDILNATRDFMFRGFDGLRALAFAILDGEAAMSGQKFELCMPKIANIRFVDAREFDRGVPAEYRNLRVPDEAHVERRAVVCEPARGLFGRWSRRYIPSRVLMRELPEPMMFHFTDNATVLMEQRARSTYPLFRALADEFADLEFPIIAKCGYDTDHGSREHLWFSVKGMRDDSFTAVLENEPFDVAALRHGESYEIGVEKLTDWMLFTPWAPINSYNTTAARMIRSNHDALRAAVKKREKI